MNMINVQISELQMQATLVSKLGASSSIGIEDPYWRQLLSDRILLTCMSPADVQASAGPALFQLGARTTNQNFSAHP
jgi:hypothetical protein